MEAVAEIARRYSDVELEVFFESEDSDEPVSNALPAEISVVDAVDRRPSEGEIAADLAKIAAALVQQPFRSSNNLGLKRMISAAPTKEWLRLSDLAATDSVHCGELENLRSPAVLRGKLEEWPARKKWGSSERLLEFYPNLKVVATRLVPVGDLGKSQVNSSASTSFFLLSIVGHEQKIIVSLAAYLKYCEETDSDFPLYVFDYDLPSSVLRFDYTCPPLDCFKRDLFDPGKCARF